MNILEKHIQAVMDDYLKVCLAQKLECDRSAFSLTLFLIIYCHEIYTDGNETLSWVYCIPFSFTYLPI